MPVDFNPKDLPEGTMERARQDVEACAGFPEIWEDEKHEKWLESVEFQCMLMKVSARATLRALDHPDPRMRLLALTSASTYSSHSEDFARACLRLGFHDPEQRVRAHALRILQRHYYACIQDQTGALKALMHYCKEPKQEMVAEIIAFETRARNAMAKARALLTERYEKRAGPLWEEMMRDPDAARRYLAHPDPGVRIAALDLLSQHPILADECCVLAERMLSEDPDVEVREEAFSYIRQCYRDSDDPRIGEMLARMVYDHDEDPRIRSGAYYELFVLRGMPYFSWPKVYIKEFSLEKDVDWAFVDSFILFS